MSITGCILVKNEANLLSSCLESIANYVDEIVLVDNGSTDETRSIAEVFGCKVLYLPDAILDEGRNAYLEVATEPWIFVIDADERITPEAGQEIRRAIANMPSHVMGISLPRFDYHGAGKWAFIPHLRIWRNHPRIRYNKSSIHATTIQAIMEMGGGIETVYGPIHHLDILLDNRSIGKRERNMNRLLAEVDANPHLHLYIGLELMSICDFKRAELEYKTAIEKVPICEPLARLFLAQLHLAEGNIPAAEENAYKLARMDSSLKDDRQLFALGVELFFRRGKKADALNLCYEALTRYPMSPHMHINAASLLEDVNPSKAVEHINRAISLNPYLLKPIIYKQGEKPNLFHYQSSLISSTRTIYEHMERCWHNLGERELSRAWNQVGEEIRNIVAQNETSLLFNSFYPKTAGEMMPMSYS